MCFFFFFFLPKRWVQPVGSFYWVILNIFTQVLGYFFFLPKRWVQLVGSFYWVILTPTDGLSLSPVKLLNNAAVKSMSFLLFNAECNLMLKYVL